MHEAAIADLSLAARKLLFGQHSWDELHCAAFLVVIVEERFLNY